LGQAITNILKNAVEAVGERKNLAEKPYEFNGIIQIDIHKIADRFEIKIQDNGAGLPKDRERLLEPYVTTRQTGSGLGLAIVKKIVEEHFASIEFSDATPNGAVVIISLPVGMLVSSEHAAAEQISA
jgi:two-component system nitrogen regulation sensor histidine kinase NtrY